MVEKIDLLPIILILKLSGWIIQHAFLRGLKDKIVELDVHCVFSEPQFQPKIVFTVAEGTQANTGVLDPLGASIADGPELYFTLIRDMAFNLQECLSKRG